MGKNGRLGYPTNCRELKCRQRKDVFRNKKDGFDDLVMETACGLHNLRTANRSPFETISLVDFYFREDIFVLRRGTKCVKQTAYSQHWRSGGGTGDGGRDPAMCAARLSPTEALRTA